MSLVLGLIPIIIIGWYIAGIGMQGWSGILLYLGVPKRRPTDVSQQNLVPPARTKEIIATLESLGFHRLGEAQVDLPSRKSLSYWVLVNPDNTIHAEAIFDRVSFSTCFRDDVFVVTDYPSGERINTARYASYTIVTNINDALNYHREQVDRFMVKYGSPHGISSMADYLRWEVVGRVNYGRMKLKRFFWIDVIRLGIFFYGALIIMGLPIAWKAHLAFLPENLPYANIELAIIGLTLPAIFVPQILFRRAINVSKRDSRNVP
jgi:hypothetical protein